MSWRLAESLKILRVQLNEAFPHRSKASDGSIGDEKHSARSSDHNPNGKGVVCAIDVTNDPATGVGGQWLADMLVKHKDPRIKYIIWNKQICSSKQSPWKWRPYHGINAHQHHVHISVDAEPKLYDSMKKWVIDFPDDESNDIATVSTVALEQKLDDTPAPSGNVVVDSTITADKPTELPSNTTVEQTTVEQTETGVTATTTTNTQDTEVVAAKPGWKTTIGALFTAVYGYYKLAKEDFGDLIDKATGALDAHLVANILIGAGLLAAAYWLYNRSQQRAHEKTLELIKAAADKTSNTVNLK